MTSIESEHVSVNAPINEVFTFLLDINNHEKLMPEQIVNWQSTDTTCSFTIKGTADLALKQGDITDNKRIQLIPNGKAPFELDLVWTLMEEGNATKAQLVLNAELNMFLKMVAVKPLQNFLNLQAENLKGQF